MSIIYYITTASTGNTFERNIPFCYSRQIAKLYTIFILVITLKWLQSRDGIRHLIDKFTHRASIESKKKRPFLLGRFVVPLYTDHVMILFRILAFKFSNSPMYMSE